MILVELNWKPVPGTLHKEDTEHGLFAQYKFTAYCGHASYNVYPYFSKKTVSVGGLPRLMRLSSMKRRD